MELTGRWKGFRFILGPWRWMLILYAFDADADRVDLVTIQDSGTARSATSLRSGRSRFPATDPGPRAVDHYRSGSPQEVMSASSSSPPGRPSRPSV